MTHYWKEPAKQKRSDQSLIKKVSKARQLQSAEHLAFLLQHSKFEWALDHLNQNHDTQRSMLASLSLKAACEHGFTNEILFEDWFEAAIALPVSELNEPQMATQRLDAMMFLAQHSDPIAKPYLEDLIAATPYFFYQQSCADDRSFYHCLCPQLNTKHPALISAIDELIAAKFEPGSLTTHDSSIAVTSINHSAVSVFYDLLQSDFCSALRLIDGADEDTRPFMYATGAQTFVQSLLDDDEDSEEILLMAESCKNMPVSIRENHDEWIGAITVLCDHLSALDDDDDEFQEATQALIDAAPKHFFTEDDIQEIQECGSMGIHFAAYIQSNIDYKAIVGAVPEHSEEHSPLERALASVRASKIRTHRQRI